MGDTTEIAWTDSTFNPWIGCAKVSAGCKNCYASVETFTRRERARGIELWGENAARHVTSDANWKKPIAWDREAAKAGVRRRVFCASMADVFEDRPDLLEPRATLWRLIEITPWLDWLVLTKRPENAARLAALAADAASATATAWPANVWLGTTVEDQRRADERIPQLLRVPAAVRFLSCEPLLEAVSLTDIVDGRDILKPLARLRWVPQAIGTGVVPRRHGGIDWVIVGGESGHHARPFDVAWARAIVSQCRDAGVAVFVKQLGAFPFGDGGAGWAYSMTSPREPKHWRWDDRDAGGAMNVYAQHDRKGGDMSEWPADLRVREFPASAVKS